VLSRLETATPQAKTNVRNVRAKGMPVLLFGKSVLMGSREWDVMPRLHYWGIGIPPDFIPVSAE
jgi:hypothetical protein